MKRILIVDGDVHIRGFLAGAILKLDSNTVDTAESVSAAVWKFAENHYDILITGIRMPETSGHFLIRHVKTFFPDCKILAISGDITALEDAVRFGACAYLAKPFSASEIMEKIEKLKCRTEEEYVRR